MTYAEKLIELGKQLDFDIIIDCDNPISHVIINNINVVDDCPDSYFDLPKLEEYCTIDCINCWYSEYKNERFLGFPVDVTSNTTFDTPIKCNAVEHPSHYNAHNIEVIDFIQDWDLNFCLGNVIKYICRADFKGKPIEDLKKAMEYLKFEINLRENRRV